MPKFLLTLIFFLFTTRIFADALIYIQPDYRQHNRASSCVFASGTTACRMAHLWKEADKLWENNHGRADASRLSNALDRVNVKHKVYRHESDQDLIKALERGHCLCVTWGGSHCVNLVGNIKGRAYIVDNNHPDH